jgi:curved DNA-binding protein CbpA
MHSRSAATITPYGEATAALAVALNVCSPDAFNASERNVISGSGAAGILLLDAGGSPVTGTVIAGNYISSDIGRVKLAANGRHTIEVAIPAGVTAGQQIRIPGEGGKGSGNASAGDLYLVIRIAPHPRYRVQGRDISVDLPLAPWEAALGTTVSIEIPAGEAKVRVPPGSSTGRRLRLRGEGLPNPRGTPGDLYAEVKIMVPKKLTSRERELFSQLARESTFDPRRR